MSRKGKLPVVIPNGVTVVVGAGNHVEVRGPKGVNVKSFNTTVAIKIDGNQVVVSPVGDSRLARSMYGTARAIINWMVHGVVAGFSKELSINGVGFEAAVKGSSLELKLGYSEPINYPIPSGISIIVAEKTKLTVSGVDKELVGQVASAIWKYRPVEPYKGKGVTIVGQFVRRKEGKKAA